MKLHLTLDVVLPATWAEPNLTLDETLALMAEEYPSIAGLLADVLAFNTPRTIAIGLSRGEEWLHKEWPRKP